MGACYSQEAPIYRDTSNRGNYREEIMVYPTSRQQQINYQRGPGQPYGHNPNQQPGHFIPIQAPPVIINTGIDYQPQFHHGHHGPQIGYNNFGGVEVEVDIFERDRFGRGGMEIDIVDRDGYGRRGMEIDIVDSDRCDDRVEIDVYDRDGSLMEVEVFDGDGGEVDIYFD
jgi:hypothetical protein